MAKKVRKPVGNVNHDDAIDEIKRHIEFASMDAPETRDKVREVLNKHYGKAGKAEDKTS